VFTARYGLIAYIKQIAFRILKVNVGSVILFSVPAIRFDEVSHPRIHKSAFRILTEFEIP
jgi:hypothetical protein